MSEPTPYTPEEALNRAALLEKAGPYPMPRDVATLRAYASAATREQRLREALEEIVKYCDGDAYRCATTARRALGEE